MFEKRSSRIAEIVIIIIFGAIVSVINTLWLRINLLKEVQRIAKNSELNIVNSKVTDIGSRMSSK